MNALKTKSILLTLIVLLSIFAGASMALAVSSANISYNETDLGGGWWQYDYMFTNTSTASEEIYGLLITFDTQTEFVSLLLPDNWNGISGMPTTSFAMAYSPSLTYDIDYSETANISFKIKDYTGDIDYTVFLDDHAGTRSTLSGNTVAVAPEPVSTILFLTGSATLGARGWIRRKRQGV